MSFWALSKLILTFTKWGGVACETTSVHGSQCNFRLQNTTSVHSRQFRSISASPQYFIHCFQHDWAKKRPGAAYPESEHSIEWQVSRENYPDHLKTIMSHCEKITPKSDCDEIWGRQEIFEQLCRSGCVNRKILEQLLRFPMSSLYRDMKGSRRHGTSLKCIVNLDYMKTLNKITMKYKYLFRCCYFVLL